MQQFFVVYLKKIQLGFFIFINFMFIMFLMQRKSKLSIYVGIIYKILCRHEQYFWSRTTVSKQYFKINLFLLTSHVKSERTSIICTKPFQLFTNKHKKQYFIFLLATSSSRHALSSITIILVCPPYPNFSATHGRQLNSKREMIFKNFQFHGSLLLF